MTQPDLAQPCATCNSELATGALYCARCGFAQGEPTGASTPEPPDGPARSAILLSTRPSTTSLVILAIVVGVILAVSLPLLAIRSAFYAPKDVVNGYFAALGRRDADAAWNKLAERSRGARAENPLLGSGALRIVGYLPPERVKVSKVDVNGKNATARVEYEVTGAPRVAEMKLDRGGPGAGLLERWHITNGLLQLEVSAPKIYNVLVAGNPVAAELWSHLQAFPGGYRLALPDHPLIEAPPISLAAGDQSNGPITPVLRATARPEIDRQVRAWLDECAKSHGPEPAGCPFSYPVSSLNPVSNVSWKIVQYPELRVEVNQAGEVTVSSNTNGTAQISGRTPSIFYPTLNEAVNFPVQGTAVALGNAIRFTPHG